MRGGKTAGRTKPSGAGNTDMDTWRRCAKKTRFNNEHDALRRAKEYGLRAYGCSKCYGWHLTHKQATTKAYAPPARAVPPSPERVAVLRLQEAEKVLTQLRRRRRSQPQLPASIVERASERVEEARKTLEETRARKAKTT